MQPAVKLKLFIVEKDCTTDCITNSGHVIPSLAFNYQINIWLPVSSFQLNGLTKNIATGKIF